jgi:5-methylcytosine-specific restriction protein A
MLEAQTTSGWLLARASRREAMPTLQEFTDELKTQLRQAELKSSTYLEINSGDLHRKLGGYPAQGGHQMPSCCDAMYAEQRAGDEILSRPPKGRGASLTIRYKLPRR